MIKILKNNLYLRTLHSIIEKYQKSGLTNNSCLYARVNTFTFVSNKRVILKPKQEQVQFQKNQTNKQQKQQILKTYLQIIPPHRLQSILHPQKSQITEFISKAQGVALTHEQLLDLHKKIKKYVHIIPIQQLGELLQCLSSHLTTKNSNTSIVKVDQQYRLICRKIYTKILTVINKKLPILSLQQIINFVYKLVKNNFKQFQFMKQVQKIIIEQKIKIDYSLIRKILFSYTHLDVGSSVLYAHICKTIKVGQHQLHPLQIAQCAYMLSKTSQNASGGYGVFSIAQKHLLIHFPRLEFNELVKAASFMFTQNIGSNQFQMELQSQLYKKYPDRSNLRINELVSLLKSTSAYYFKFKDKALLNLLHTSTNRLAPQANLGQFQDIIWSWGRSAKGDRQLWQVLQQEISKKYINVLKPRQLAFFYFSLCSTEYSSKQAIKLLQNKFIKTVQQNPNINEHYLIKYLLGMQKRKNFSQEYFTVISKMITQRLEKLSVKQLVTFVKILNQSDLCYQNKEKFKQIQQSLVKVCEKAIGQKIYLFRVTQIVQILFMWVKFDIKNSQVNQAMIRKARSFMEKLMDQIGLSTHQIPKSVFIKALFCFTINDRYKQSMEMIVILQELLKFGPITYFFSPFQLPLMAYCVYHFIVNGNMQFKINPQLVEELGSAMDKINPVILNNFIRNGYNQSMKLKARYQQMKASSNLGANESKKTKKRKK